MRRACLPDICSWPRYKTDRRAPRAVVVVELILMLPVLLVFLIALIEFGLILANTKVVALASRNGAKLAAESPAFSITQVTNVVNASLATANIQSCKVILEHNVVAGGPSPLTSGTCNCSAPSIPTLPGGSQRAVRVTVCVELSQLTPNLLTAFGFTTANRTVSESTLYPYEH